MFQKQWRKILQQHKKSRGKILITLVHNHAGTSNESPGKTSSKETSGATNMMFTTLSDDSHANCTCSRFAITCAVVLAGILATNVDSHSKTTNVSDQDATLVGIKDGTTINPLSLVDRLLPGISQVCDFELMKRLLDIR